MKTNKLVVLVGMLVLSTGALAKQPLTAEQWKDVNTMLRLERGIGVIQEKSARLREAIKQIDDQDKMKAELKELYVKKAQLEEMAREEQREAQQAAKQRRQSMIEWQINNRMHEMTNQPTTEW